MKQFVFFLMCISTSLLIGQTNMHFSNSSVEGILKGNYDPQQYNQTNPITLPSMIIQGINANVSPDSLHSYLAILDNFYTRNTGSDTTSPDTGIGAARTWILKKFGDFSSASENRLVTSYFVFDQAVCNVNRHKNVMAVLPGSDTSQKEIVIIEGHFDSRCENSCDTACQAEGMEDNGSGTALVMELARVMSGFTFNKTIVFMATTGEEQGLIGANAFATYVTQENIDVKAVLNNDVIGGIICGQTSSPPSCPGQDNIDSTQVRLFSNGGYSSKHKCLVRYIKTQYQEDLLPIVKVPMTISIMTGEDRIGRGGDHIPFRQRNIAAMRFTSANEHGDAGVGPGYTDRQHTTDDILGVDTDGNNTIDSFFVDFNYLSRNAVINGVAAAGLLNGPETPEITVSSSNGNLMVNVQDPNNYNSYKIGVRSLTWDFDTVIAFSGTQATLTPGVSGTLFLSIMSVDSNGLESLPYKETVVFKVDIEENKASKENGYALLQNNPNPFDEHTIIGFYSPKSTNKAAQISITDLNGKIIKEFNIEVEEGINEVLYSHGYGIEGTFIYSLIIDGKLIESKRMVFAY